MNLRVDLILDTEKRSASILNARSMIRLSIVLVPVIIVTMIFMTIVGFMKLKSTRANMETEWDIKKEQKTEALKIQKELSLHRSIQKELEGWRKSHMDWHKQIIGLMEAVPHKIQLNSFLVEGKIATSEKSKARNFTMKIEGAAIGAGSDQNVELLKKKLTSQEPFKAYMEKVNYGYFKEDDSAGANRVHDRIFQLVCDYKTREF